MKIKLFFLLLVCAFIDASGMTLWEKYWKDDLRQFPTTQVDKYFADIVDLASPCGAIPAARVKVARKSFSLGKARNYMDFFRVFPFFLTLCSLFSEKTVPFHHVPMLILNHLLFYCFFRSNDLYIINYTLY